MKSAKASKPRFTLPKSWIGAALWIAAAAVSGCGGGNPSHVTHPGDGGLPVVGSLDLQPPPRTVSYTNDNDHPLAPLAVFSKSANATANGNSLVLDSSDGNLAWAIYEFGNTGQGSFYYQDSAAGITLNAGTPASNLTAPFGWYAAVADFSRDGWRFSGEIDEPGEQTASLPAQDRAVNSSHWIYLAVVVYGGAAVELEGVTGQFNLAGRTLDHIDSRLPAGDLVNIPVRFKIKAVDENEFTVFGFNGSGTVSSDPGGISVTEQPVFDEGSAYVTAEFPAVGTYELLLDGADPALDGSLGEIQIYETQLPVVEIIIDDADYHDLRVDPYTDEYKPCVFRYDGAEFTTAATRFRGGDARDFPKKSWKVSLPEDAGLADIEWNYLSRETFNFSAEYTDPTFMRDALSYDMFALMGVPAPRHRFVHLRVNDEYYGLFLDVENPRKHWLSEMGLNNDGVLYNVVDNRFETLASPELYNGPFEKQTRELEPFDDLHYFIFTVNNLAEQNVYLGLKSLIKMNLFRKYMVVNAAVSQRRHLRHNHYLYYDDMDSGEWLVIPWDYDFTWGRQNESEKLFNYTLMYDSPIDWGDWDKYDDGNNLMTIYLNDPTFFAEYKQEIANTLDLVFTEQIWNDRITEYYDLIYMDALADPNKYHDFALFDGFVDDLREYITQRRAYLANAIAQ